MNYVRELQSRHLFAAVFHLNVVYDYRSFKLPHLGHPLSIQHYSLSCHEPILIIHNSFISFIHYIVHQYTAWKLTVASVLILNWSLVHYVCIATALKVPGWIQICSNDESVISARIRTYTYLLRIRSCCGRAVVVAEMMLSLFKPLMTSVVLSISRISIPIVMLKTNRR